MDEQTTMGTPNLAAFKATIATRGLSVASFDGYTLRLAYNPHADIELQRNGQVPAGDLPGFANQAINAQLDGNTPELFPGMRNIVVT